MLRELGHQVLIVQEYTKQWCDVLIALHSRRSHTSISRFADQRPGAPLIVGLTGTDLFGDLATSSEAQASVALATRLIVLQPLGVENLSEDAQLKTRVIFQSVERPTVTVSKREDVFEVCVMGHLREVKDPFRTAMAVRLLPARSRIQVTHIGKALTPEMERLASIENATNPRYRWLGELRRGKAMRVLGRCRLLVLTSIMEGGANAISEAIVASVPVLSSRILGSVGLLGEDYPGYFPTGDTGALAELLQRSETDTPFYESLASACERAAPLFDPAKEKRALQNLLAEMDGAAGAG